MVNTKITVTAEPGVSAWQLERLFLYLAECHWGEPVTKTIQVGATTAECSLTVGSQQSSFKLVWLAKDWYEEDDQ